MVGLTLDLIRVVREKKWIFSSISFFYALAPKFTLPRAPFLGSLLTWDFSGTQSTSLTFPMKHSFIEIRKKIEFKRIAFFLIANTFKPWQKSITQASKTMMMFDLQFYISCVYSRIQNNSSISAVPNLFLIAYLQTEKKKTRVPFETFYDIFYWQSQCKS